MDSRLIVGILVSLIIVWASSIALLWLLKPKDARLGDLVRVVPDVVRLVRVSSLTAPRRLPCARR